MSLAEKYLSEHGLSVADVAKKVGIFDYNYFSPKIKSQILIDVGINRDESGKLCGDIAEEVNYSQN